MDRSEWMYNINRVTDPRYLAEVRKFIAAAIVDRDRSKQTTVICPCNRCKNKSAFTNEGTVQSHLIRFGFMENYTVWTHHGERADSSVGAASGVCSTSTTVDQDLGAYVSSSSATAPPACSDSSARDYMSVEDVLQDMADGGGDVEEATVKEPEDVHLFETLVDHIDEDDVVYGSPKWLENFREMKQASLDTLYADGGECPKDCTVLRFNLHMLMMKARHGWSDSSFDELLGYLAKVFPTSNKVPANTYRAKKLIRPVAMKLRKYDACTNHCILYRGTEYENLTSCPHCGASRYKKNAGCRVDADDDEALRGGQKKKKKGGKKSSAAANRISAQQEEEEEGYTLRKSPALSVWYLPVTDRLRALFGNPEDAKLMSWHASADRLKDDGMLRHPSDAQQWKDFDKAYPQFAKDPRNVRFALSTDGMNPFGELSSSHSTWPVVLTIYNLPPHLCHRRRYLLLTMLISGPKQPGNDIDVFLEPVMEEMKELFDVGVEMVDASLKKKFTLKAIIFVTITDYPGLFSLSGQIKGKTGCVMCIDGTCYAYLKGSNKMVYMRHRRFLSKRHRYRRSVMNQFFDDQCEPQLEPPAETCWGPKVFEMVKDMDQIEFGKKKKAPEDGTKPTRKRKRDTTTEAASQAVPTIPFKKRSIFFEYLSYWKTLKNPHAIDCMHLEKNVFESTIGVLLDIPGKTKDGLKSRTDLVNQGIRQELHPGPPVNGKIDLPGAAYNLRHDEKTAMLKLLRGIKVPTGFSSNIKSLVSPKDLTLTGYNAHDCHVMLTVFLPIVIRAIGPEYVKMVICRMSYFFNRITQKVIGKADLPALKEFIAETLCQLEMCFPPSYFDIMVHLMMHMVDQIEQLGPVYLHQMWTYERFMSTLNRYVHNRAYPEGSMIEAYTTEEAVNWCMRYIKDGRAIGLPIHRHEGRTAGMGCTGRKLRTDIPNKEVEQAHYSILHQLVSMEKYVEKHLEEIRAANDGQRTEAWVQNEHKSSFINWLKEQHVPLEGCPDADTETVKKLVLGPSSQVTTWQGYDVKGYRFHTKEKDKKSAAQNCGVRYEGVDEATNMRTQYYGQIEEIWELDYGKNVRVTVFRCQWVNPKAVAVDSFGLTTVNLKSVGYKDDQWVLATNVAQVAYFIYSEDPKRHVVVSGKQRIVGADGVQSPEQYNNYEELQLFTDFAKKIKAVEDRCNKSGMKPWARPDGEKRSVKAPAPK